MMYAHLSAPATPSDTNAEAWGAYVGGLRDKIATSKDGAVAAYNTLKQVRQNLGLPFITVPSGEAATDTGGWSVDLEQQAIDILAMATLCKTAADDVLAGKRKLMWDDKQDDFAIEGFSTDVVRLQKDANGVPVLVDASGAVTHVTGQVGIAPLIVFGVVAGLAVVQAVGMYLLVDKALTTMQIVTEQKTQRTLAEVAKKHADLIASGKATPEEGVNLNKSVYAGAAELAKQTAASKKPITFESDTLKTLGYVALGLGILYAVVKFMSLKGPSGAPVLAPARASSNPKRPMPMAGYSYFYDGSNWKRVPDDMWEHEVLSLREIEDAQFVGTRVIDGVRVNVWQLATASPYIAQTAFSQSNLAA